MAIGGKHSGQLPDEDSSVDLRVAHCASKTPFSRSQAKSMLNHVSGCRILNLDFSGVERIGQAFADEVFRVFANDHPEIELQAVHASTEVQQMIRRAEVARDAGSDQLPLL